ncbi:MAG: RHS repeat domain-containing protein [Bellilinea sp.]
MMSQPSKREMIEAIRPRYLKANKGGKQQILDELIATNGTDVTQYSYEAADRLSSVTLPDGTTVAYAYDAVGRRVR